MKSTIQGLVLRFRLVLLLLTSLAMISCSFVKYSALQARYARIQGADPSQVNLKHMIKQEKFFVIGKVTDRQQRLKNTDFVVAAYSNKFSPHERVDTMNFSGTGRHFGLMLPEGDYDLLLYADLDEDGQFSSSEVVAQRQLQIDKQHYPQKIVNNIDLHASNAKTVSWAEQIASTSSENKQQSLYYPEGTIRSLNDPMFDKNIATMGMYDPASFLEHASTMFYALEEDEVHKIPIVFVHGIGGSTREFTSIINQLDSERYRFWFYYYPSGGDLEQLADFFYTLFLSGDVIPLNDMPLVVVAHSMGGLVVREAINQYAFNSKENRIKLFISIASPFGGHPAAAQGEKYSPMVLPAWEDLNPESLFIKQLFRNPVPEFLSHELFYAYKDTRTVKFSENSDGVVPLSSQLTQVAQNQSTGQFGFNSSHSEILHDQAMIDRIISSLSSLKSIFPESHMEILRNGGLNIELDDTYDAKTRHLMGYAGKYLMLLVNGAIKPFHPTQQKFIDAVKGKRPADTLIEREFKRFFESPACTFDKKTGFSCPVAH